MSHWTIDKNSGQGSDTIKVTPSSSNSLTTDITESITTATTGGVSKLILLLHKARLAPTIDVADGDLTGAMFNCMCYNSNVYQLTGAAGNVWYNTNVDEREKKETFWDVRTFPTITINYTSSETEVEDQEFNPSPTGDAYAVMDVTELGNKASSPQIWFRLNSVYKNVSGGRKRILHGATVLDATNNFYSYPEAWEAYVEFDASSNFTAIEIYYSGLGDLSGNYYRVEFDPTSHLNFQVSCYNVFVTNAYEEVLLSWECGLSNNDGGISIEDGRYCVEYPKLYLPCVVDGLDKRINNVEIYVW